MNIYTYTEPEIYLKDMLYMKKRKNPQFSLRAWARLLGMKTHTPLQLMLASKRPIPKKYIPLFGKSLTLSLDEIEYLELMIDHQRAKNPKAKELAKKKMLDVRNARLGIDTTEGVEVPDELMNKSTEIASEIINLNN
tara:strand:+ start:61887 stop:62297 length:411 start_codon:yes stop_codon:yes gene_type:complete